MNWLEKLENGKRIRFFGKVLLWKTKIFWRFLDPSNHGALKEPANKGFAGPFDTNAVIRVISITVPDSDHSIPIFFRKIQFLFPLIEMRLANS